MPTISNITATTAKITPASAPGVGGTLFFDFLRAEALPNVAGVGELKRAELVMSVQLETTWKNTTIYDGKSEALRNPKLEIRKLKSLRTSHEIKVRNFEFYFLEETNKYRHDREIPTAMCDSMDIDFPKRPRARRASLSDLDSMDLDLPDALQPNYDVLGSVLREMYNLQIFPYFMRQFEWKVDDIVKRYAIVPLAAANSVRRAILVPINELDMLDREEGREEPVLLLSLAADGSTRVSRWLFN